MRDSKQSWQSWFKILKLVSEIEQAANDPTSSGLQTPIIAIDDQTLLAVVKELYNKKFPIFSLFMVDISSDDIIAAKKIMPDHNRPSLLAVLRHRIGKRNMQLYL